MSTPIEMMTAAVQNPEVDQPAPAPAPEAPAPTPEAPEPEVAAKPDIIGVDPAEAAAAPEPQLDADGRMRGPDGKFIAATPKEGGEAPAAKPEEPKVEVAAKPVEPPKTIDPVNDPIPENVKPATRERITTLVDTVKAKDAEVAAARDDFELIMAPVREAGATPQQFREVMNLVKLLNSSLTSDQQQALEYLQGAGAALSQRLGIVPPGVDPLQGYEDLQLEVHKNPGLRKWAEEAAAGRRLRDATQRRDREQADRSAQSTQRQAEAAAGQAAVRTVEQTLKDADPQYAAKVAVMRSDAGFVAQLKAMPPAQWATAFAEKYRTVKIAQPVAPAPAPTPGQQPLRAKQPAGQAGRVAATSLEAVSAAIASVGA